MPLCSMPYALCSMPYALCPIPAIISQGDGFASRFENLDDFHPESKQGRLRFSSGSSRE